MGAVLTGILSVIVSVLAEFFQGTIRQKNADVLGNTQEALKDNRDADETHNRIFTADDTVLDPLRDKWS